MLDALFAPQSVAVIGASRDEKKVGHAVLLNIVKYGYQGRISPINPSSSEILGLRAYPRISDAPGTTDLAIIAVPAKLVPGTLHDCALAGVKAAVIITAGFKETGAEGTLLEEEIKKIGKKHGIRLLGPNCLGVINTLNNMNATFAAGMLPKGRISFFSQSGALGIAILDWAIGNEVGFSKFVSLGNKADLSETDFIEYFMDDPETDVILGYIEDVSDGKRFLDVASRATKKKPVVLLKAGGTEAGARAASSHTGALAGSDIAFDAAFRQSGVIRARGIQELFDTALAFAAVRRPRGNRLLVITNAGGPGILAADEAERSGIKLPHMTKEGIEAIKERLPKNASLYNPVDVIGDATSARYGVVLEQAARDPNVDGILVILTPQAMTDVDETAEVVIKASKLTDKPIISSFMGEARVREGIKKLKEAGVPNFSYPEAAIKAFKRLADQTAWMARPAERPYEMRVGTAARNKIEELRKSRIQNLAEDAAAGILSEYSFRFPKRALAKTAREAVDAASEIGFPVVMKIASPDILHKTDVGGVRLNISSAEAARNAFREITTNVRRLMPHAFIEGVMVFEMVPAGREVILGATFDRTFGHMLMFGLGGIYVEVMKDVSFRIAPVTRRDAEEMIGEVKTAALLRGVRGQRPADTEAVVDSILRLSCLVVDFPEIREVDINPLVVMEKGAIALDARMTLELG